MKPHRDIFPTQHQLTINQVRLQLADKLNNEYHSQLISVQMISHLFGGEEVTSNEIVQYLSDLLNTFDK